MSGLMSITGHGDDEPGGGPMRVGYSVGDITAGFYAVAAILAALHHRDMVLRARASTSTCRCSTRRWPPSHMSR